MRIYNIHLCIRLYIYNYIYNYIFTYYIVIYIMHNYCIVYPFFKTPPDFHPVADMSPRCCRRCLRSQAAKANRKRDVDPGDSHSFLGPATKKATTSMGMVYKLIYKKYPEKRWKMVMTWDWWRNWVNPNFLVDSSSKSQLAVCSFLIRCA
jgi:hypothetical protein